MVRFILLLIGLVLSVHCNSQDSLFVLHPLVGDTIDQKEKLNYFLFQNIKDSNFRYCTITHSGIDFFAKVYTVNDTIFIQKIEAAEINESIIRLDKVRQYFANQNNMNTSKINQKETTVVNEPPASYPTERIINSEMKDKIIKETIRDQRLKYDTKRQTEVRQGSNIAGDDFLQIIGSGRKKRK